MIFIINLLGILGGFILHKIFTAAATALLVMSIASSAFAHSHLEGSNPADGEMVTKPLTEIVLEFDGHIEQGSFLDVATTSGQAIELKDIIIEEGTLKGTVAESLPNNEYKVNWSIISTDSHPLEGEFSFTVNAPVSETVEKETEESSVVTSTVENSKEEASADEEASSSSFTTGILILLLVIIVAGGFFFLTKRKK